jgi:C4-dicarboxylate-specific signal transduction histidine kinase
MSAGVTTMGELAASIVHEVDQPLAGMLTRANRGLRREQEKRFQV